MTSREPQDLVLYGYPRTRTTRVRWWLEELGVVYDFVQVDIKKDQQDDPDFRALSPLGRIPVLVHKKTVIFEVLAICMYLAHSFPSQKLYYPKPGTPESAKFIQWLSFTTTELDQAVGRYFMAHRSRHLAAEKKGLKAAADAFRQRLQPYEQRLQDAEFLVGSRISGADIYSASLLAFADSLSLITKQSPVRAWLDRLVNMPSYKRAIAPIDDDE